MCLQKNHKISFRNIVRTNQNICRVEQLVFSQNQPRTDRTVCQIARETEIVGPKSNAVLESNIFFHLYLKTNNYAGKQYFRMKFCGSFTDLFRINCT